MKSKFLFWASRLGVAYNKSLGESRNFSFFIRSLSYIYSRVFLSTKYGDCWL